MKLEVGESLILSWMRHVLGCRMVQMNWKPSSAWSLAGQDDLERCASDLKAHFLEVHQRTIFKKGTLLQTIRQGEIDVLGLRPGKDGGVELHAVDVAFHEAGLNYGTREETISRVLKKLIRTAIGVQGYFPGLPADIVFATPVAEPSLLTDLDASVGELNEGLAQHFPWIRARLLGNESFRAEIMEKVVIASTEVADTSELFLRSLQLLTAAGFDVSPPAKAQPRQEANLIGADLDGAQAGPGGGEQAIGDYAQTSIRKLAAAGRIPPHQVTRLVDKVETKKIFGSHFGFALLLWLDTSEKKPKDARANLSKKVRVRYWEHPIVIDGQYYLVCSQWWKDHAKELRQRLDAWMATLPPAAVALEA